MNQLACIKNARMEGKTMGHKFAEFMFTPSVKEMQLEQGSRNSYEKVESGNDFNQFLSEHEAEFIAQRDSFYMASVSESQWPYVQHRGGPKGFVRVLDAGTLGFSDFRGNRQYVSAGNFRSNNRVSFIFMDYPNRRRLKLIGRISVVDDSDLETLSKLSVDPKEAKSERSFLIHVDAFDWNCPKYITPRFSEDEVKKLIQPLLDENHFLKQQQTEAESYPKVSGHGPLPLVISGIRQLTPNVRAYELRHAHGLLLPEFEAGAHLKLPVRLSNGQWQDQHYSIASNPARRDYYEIAVKKTVYEMDAGGSEVIHQHFQLGSELRLEYPKNNIRLDRQQDSALLIADDVGITSIKAMAHTLDRESIPFELHYAGKSKAEMPYFHRLHKAHKYRFYAYEKDLGKSLNIHQLLENLKAHTHVYVCGPQTLINDVLEVGQNLRISTNKIHVELFDKQTVSDLEAAQD